MQPLPEEGNEFVSDQAENDEKSSDEHAII